MLPEPSECDAGVFKHKGKVSPSCFCLHSAGGRHVGAGRAPPAGETPAFQTAAERPVLHAETPAAEETREGKTRGNIGEEEHQPHCSVCVSGILQKR